MHDGEDLTVKVGKSDFFESIHVILGMLAENFQRFDGGNEIDRRTISFEVCCFLFFFGQASCRSPWHAAKG